MAGVPQQAPGQKAPQRPQQDPNSDYSWNGSSYIPNKSNTYNSPYTGLPVSQGEYNVQTQQSATQADMRNRLMGAIGGLGTSGSASMGNMDGAMSMPTLGNVPSVAHVDTSAAQRGEFANAKDQVGQETSGALAGLRSSLAGRGMLGSGAESRGTANIVMNGQGELGNTTRAQASDRAAGDRAEAALNYNGDIAQRGQSESAAATNFNGQVAERGQNLSAMTASNALAQQKQLSLVAMLNSAIGGVRPGAGQVY